MYNKTIIEFGFRMISWIIKTSCLYYLPQPITQTSGFISSLFSHFHRYYIIVIFTFVTPNTPLPSPPKRKTKSCISIVFVLPWDVRLWYCDTQDNLKIFRFFVIFFLVTDELWATSKWRILVTKASGFMAAHNPEILWVRFSCAVKQKLLWGRECFIA